MTPQVLAEVMAATWPPVSSRRLGPWTIRDGAGGGKRVSAATAEGVWPDVNPPDVNPPDVNPPDADLALAEAAMRALGQRPLFLIRDGDAALDATLAARGYRLVDRVVAYAAPTALLARPVPPMASFAHWPPLAVARGLWAGGGIGAARLAVMDRAPGPKTAILARSADRPAGVAFVALHRRDAMLHALEISPPHRRLGCAQNILAAAAGWAQEQGADRLSLVVAKANSPACGLYAKLGMTLVGHYHYRED